MPPFFTEDGKPVRHPLEELLSADAWIMLNAVARQRMALMNLKGQLAESYLDEHLQKLQANGLIEHFLWRSKSPDFEVGWRGTLFHMECKNIRSVEKRKGGAEWRVEVQRTRDSKKGKSTRAYRITDFDLLAVCLFNRTHEWEFRFISCGKMRRRATDDTLLEVFHEIPQLAGEPWHKDLTLALADAMALK